MEPAETPLLGRKGNRMDQPESGGPGISTRAIQGAGHRDDARAGIPVSPPIVQSSTFSFDSPEEMIDVFEGRRDGYVYSRYDNPTIHHVEQKLASLEKGDFALLFSSGLAAIHAVLWGTLKSGDRLLAAQDLYGGTVDLMARILPRLGVNFESANLADAAALDAALERSPAVVYFETPTNPLVRLIDGPRTVARARAAGARVVIDNTFATPVLQNPIDWGADIIIHSATKYLGGHSDVVLGVAIGHAKDWEWMEKCRRSFGGSPDPFAAWLLNRGLATLAIRIRAQCTTAGILARGLIRRGGVRDVYYPGLEGDPAHEIASRQMRGFGGMLAIDLDGGREGALEFMRRLRLFRLATSLGGVESLVSHPATSSHRMLSAKERDILRIGEGLVRLSIGLEDAEDLVEDINRALPVKRTPRS